MRGKTACLLLGGTLRPYPPSLPHPLRTRTFPCACSCPRDTAMIGRRLPCKELAQCSCYNEKSRYPLSAVKTYSSELRHDESACQRRRILTRYFSQVRIFDCVFPELLDGVLLLGGTHRCLFEAMLLSMTGLRWPGEDVLYIPWVRTVSPEERRGPANGRR